MRGADAREVATDEEQRFRMMIEEVRDYAIFFLDPNGIVTSWNRGAERIKGFKEEEIVGKHFSTFYTEDAVAAAHPQKELEIAAREGRYEEEGWRVRKDGTQFFANVVINAVRDRNGVLQGFAKVTRDVTEREKSKRALERAAAELERRVIDRTAALTVANQELEAFSYSVSHDLRAPLRALDGFSKILIDQAGSKLDESERDYLERIRKAAQKMSRLIDDLLDLSRLARAAVTPVDFDLRIAANAIIKELRDAEPDRKVDFKAEGDLQVEGDAHLLGIVLENLLRNAWKFTRKNQDAQIELGVKGEREERTFYIKDNGVGFDMKYAGKLFMPFQRMHSPRDFEGTGIGLATVRRIIRRHGGDIWPESQPGQGTTFFFTIGGRDEATNSSGRG